VVRGLWRGLRGASPPDTPALQVLSFIMCQICGEMSSGTNEEELSSTTIGARIGSALTIDAILCG